MKKALLAIVALVVVLIGVGLVLPTDFTLERKIVIRADTAKIHALVGDLKRWDEWTPWKEVDPTTVVTFGAATTGVGASQTWTGKDGDGELTFVASDPATGLEYTMNFIQGDAKTPAKGALHYTATADGTEVTWSMESDMKDMPVIGGWFAQFADSLIGKEFEKGLAKLKSVAEKG
jgi:Polyketide cyclase / dehydrase and lipid transport